MKNRIVAAVLAFFVGGFGVHKFYLGKTFQGIIYLIFSMTFIPFFIGVVEAIQLFTMTDDDFDAKYNLSREGRLLTKERYELEREKLKVERLKLESERLIAEKHLKKQIPVKAITGEQADELAAWHDLLEKGIIDETQYEEKRKIILGLVD
jgi:TM2 domain-containing membrane protein YozV